jgi:hypothetical protein
VFAILHAEDAEGNVMVDDIEPPFQVWQGFRHTWTYNHRLNRLGDWLSAEKREGDTLEIALGHSAASGSGRDEASFRGSYAAIRAAGVRYRQFRQTIAIRSSEQESQTFQREIRIGPEDGIATDCDTFAAVLAGFDLLSEKDADKLISFHLATTVPRRDARTGEIVFSILGALNVDCDSLECDNYQTTGGMIAAIIAGTIGGANIGGLPGAAAGGVIGGVFGDLFAKLNVTTNYTLEVRFALIAGRTDMFRASPRATQNTYSWDTKQVVTRLSNGVVRLELQGDDGPRWSNAVPAITQLSLEVTRRRGVFRLDTAMHLLEWDVAVVPVNSDGQSCTADAELFFRNWCLESSEFLDKKIDPPIIGGIDWLDDQVEGMFSHRDAGSASIAVGLTLLQFAEAAVEDHGNWEGSLIWAGGGASAASPDAVRAATRTTVLALSELATPPPADDTVHRIAVEHGI